MANPRVILNFISKTETGREGLAAYNTVYAHREGSMLKPLVIMTIDEVIVQGNFRTKHFGSSAAGAYQIMRDTLEGLKVQMGLTGDEKFDVAMQDRMGLELLKRRGLNRWIEGRLSDVGFALELAKEWASFPVLVKTNGAHRTVARGQSYYAGDGMNKALVSPEAIEEMLDEAKNSGVHTPEGPKAPDPAPSHWWTRLIRWITRGK